MAQGKVPSSIACVIKFSQFCIIFKNNCYKTTHLKDYPLVFIRIKNKDLQH